MAEIIFWVAAFISLAVAVVNMASNGYDSMEITWGQRRDWARREGEWRK